MISKNSTFLAAAFLIVHGLSFSELARAQEQVVYDNGSPVHGVGFYGVSYAIVADDFLLNPVSYYVVELTRVSADMLEALDKPWDGTTVRWWLFEDDGGLPGAVRASGRGQDVTATYGQANTLANTRPFVVDFRIGNPVRVEMGKRYWLALNLATEVSTDTIVMWNGTEPTNGTSALNGGDLVNGVPDFNGVNTAPAYQRRDRAFRLYGKYREPGYADTTTWPSQRGKLHGVLAKWCDIEHTSYTSLPKLVCNFPWALSANSDEYESDRHFITRSGGRNHREAMRVEMFQVFRTGATQKDFREGIQRISKIIEGVQVGRYFDDRAKASLLESLRLAKEANLDLARVLVEGMNAMELDHRFPSSVQPAEIGAAGVTNLGKEAFLAFRGLQEPGKLALQVRNDVALPQSLRGSLVGWPFGTYHFDFGGKLAEKGWVDLTLDIGRVYFPVPLRDLRVIEFDGKSWRDVTIGVDEERGLITARTNSLGSYAILVPP